MKNCNKNKYLRESRQTIASAILMLLVAGCAATASGPVDRMQLSNAIAIDDVDTVRRAVQAQVIAVNDVIPGIGYNATPMITVAARHGSINVLRYLIGAKADLNARTPDRDTALMLAALFGAEEQKQNPGAFARYDNAVRTLVDAGARLEAADLNAYSVLSYAAYAGRENTVRYLLERGARVNANVEGGVSYVNTPLMMAAMQGHRDTALHLLRAGADAKVRVRDGATALEFARKHRHTHLESLLRCAESLGANETFRGRCE